MEAFKRVEAARAKGRPTGYDFISCMGTAGLATTRRSLPGLDGSTTLR